MQKQAVRIVPIYGHMDASRELERACAVATALLDKILKESPHLAPQEAFRQMQFRLQDVCIFPWSHMQIEHYNAVDSELSSNRD